MNPQIYWRPDLVPPTKRGKLQEMTRAFAPSALQRCRRDATWAENLKKTRNTLSATARIKSTCGIEATGLPALADDSGIEVEALTVAPGVTLPTGPKRRTVVISSWQ